MFVYRTESHWQDPLQAGSNHLSILAKVSQSQDGVLIRKASKLANKHNCPSSVPLAFHMLVDGFTDIQIVCNCFYPLVFFKLKRKPKYKNQL